MSAQGEMWRVSTIEGTFEADLDTLKQWIVEGCVLPTDKVSKGSLSWIEAGRAPMLRGAFNGDAGTTTVAVATTDASAQLLPAQLARSEPLSGDSAGAGSAETEGPVAANLSAVAAAANTCHNHGELPARYICRVCAAVFCDECPRFIGTSKVPLCPLCGDLCRPIGQERERFQRQEFRSTTFGFEDFGRALRYPWQHKIALLFGAALYGFLLLTGFRGRIVAFVIMFGCIAHVINQVADGKLERSFLPDLSSFSLWDDLVCPLGLGIGITIVTWGPAILIALVFVFGVMKGPGAPSLIPNPSPRVSFTPAAPDSVRETAADPVKVGDADGVPNQPKSGYQISERPTSHSEPGPELRFITNIIRQGLIFLPFLLISVAWAIFYYPMALTVAGYTEHFGSVINPLVGLDTIRRMRGTYFKAFGMVILIQLVGFVVAILVGIVLAPFDMPFFGNVPATFVDGAVTFYFNLIIACVLGLSLHKCADRLAINVD